MTFGVLAILRTLAGIRCMVVCHDRVLSTDAVTEITLLAKLPRPAWMPANLSPQEVRDQLATLYVASIETTAADLTWRLAGRPQPPIWFVPRQHSETKEDALILLSVEHKFGAGPRKCIGEHLAEQVSQTVLRTMTETMRWRPYRLDLRPRLGLTRWPRLAIVERVE